jgi:hypothetical protein
MSGNHMRPFNANACKLPIKIPGKETTCRLPRIAGGVKSLGDGQPGQYGLPNTNFAG